MRIEKDFGLGGTTRAGVFADILNLTNSDASQGVGSRLGSSSSFGLPTSYLPPTTEQQGIPSRDESALPGEP